MISYGFTDFGNRDNVNRDKITNYDNYLNSNSIKAINQFYEKDFRLFGYPMKYRWSRLFKIPFGDTTSTSEPEFLKYNAIL
jgi:hypothetical protein